ncbi:hypothetical protein NC652_025818 [Populus alba x Populus x berolinensis]|nr:hypothetical protein NC652_025818 [Populus alba x Populus x berolinensis]
MKSKLLDHSPHKGETLLSVGGRVKPSCKNKTATSLVESSLGRSNGQPVRLDCSRNAGIVASGDRFVAAGPGFITDHTGLVADRDLESSPDQSTQANASDQTDAAMISN